MVVKEIPSGSYIPQQNITVTLEDGRIFTDINKVIIRHQSRGVSIIEMYNEYTSSTKTLSSDEEIYFK